MRHLKFLLPAVALCISAQLSAQQNESETPGKNNIIKLNLSALAISNISVQYERKIGKSISLAVNVHNRPFGKLPFLSTIEKIIDDPNVPVNQLKLGAFGITPEVRFYVGKKGALHGFYIAPFLNYNRYKIDLPIKYDNDVKTGIFAGNLSSVTGGLQFGAQWNLSHTLSLDWWIAGPNYGGAKGNLDFNTALSPSDQADLRNQIEDVKSNAPFDKLIESYSVTGNGAFIQVKGPWAGIRGLGINLGIRF